MKFGVGSSRSGVFQVRFCALYIIQAQTERVTVNMNRYIAKYRSHYDLQRPGREADYSPPSSAEVKECVELYLHSPNTPSWRGA